MRVKTLRDQALLFLCGFSFLTVALCTLYLLASPEGSYEDRFSRGADAAAYLLPCIAALTGGFGIFLGFDSRSVGVRLRSKSHRAEKRLYFFSMVILYFGVISYVAARPCRIPGTLIALECEMVSCALVLRAGYKAARFRTPRTFRARFGSSILVALLLASAAFGVAAFFLPGVLFANGRCVL